MTIRRCYRQSTWGISRHGLLAMTLLGFLVVLSMAEGNNTNSPATIVSNAPAGSTAPAGSPAPSGLSPVVPGGTATPSIVETTLGQPSVVPVASGSTTTPSLNSAPSTSIPSSLSSSGTGTPSVIGSDIPVASPVSVAPTTSAPSVVGTGSPTVKATTAATSAPTSAPTALQITGSPTAPPPTPLPTVESTTGIPTTASPTTSPTVVTAAPSPKPTVTTGTPTQATSSPSGGPTRQPVTGAPSDTPFGPPTISPSGKPTRKPSDAPTEHPSHSPSMKPTHVGSTRKPSFPSAVPSLFPSEAPSQLTEAPLYRNLNMTLNGISSFPAGAQNDWMDVTQNYISDYFTKHPGLQIDVPARSIIINVVTSSVSFSRRRLSSRGLQSGKPSVLVTYNQEFQYKSADPNQDTTYIVKQPFSGADDRSSYLTLLKDKNPFFDSVSDTSAVVAPGDNVVKNTDNSGGLSQLAIIIIAVGAGVLGVAILMSLCYYMSSQRGRRLRRGYLSKKNDEDSPPTQLQLGSGADEVSTLAEPQTQNKMGRGAHESIAGYGDQSVTTVDYDYSKAYGGAGDTSVSSAGGTFGSNTQGNVEVTASAAAAGAALGNSYSDSDSFDAHYREPGANIKEELIDIYAPPGKLGVVIDTPDDGAPVVHAIKDSSVIADKLQVGDKLVAVDDEDVRAMTAIKVSKLISKKSSNPTRKLSVLRTTIVE